MIWASGSRRATFPRFVSPRWSELTSAEVYPLGWSEANSLEWGSPWYDGLTQFFDAAARADDAMLVWLD
jgi:hypothetical protein